MILVIPTGNQDEDRMLECEAHALQRKYFSKKTRDKYGISFFQPKRGILYVANDKQLPLLDLASGEKLYIVGHTVINNYEMTLSGMTPEQLASCLMNSGLNIHQRGLKLNLIGCRAGKKLHPLKGSYAWQLWNHLVVHLNEIDFRFRAAEICSLPTIKAPKTAIRFDGRGESYVIPEKVDKAYLEILNSGRVSPTQRESWVNAHERKAVVGDYQLVGNGIFKPRTSYRIAVSSGSQLITKGGGRVCV